MKQKIIKKSVLAIAVITGLILSPVLPLITTAQVLPLVNPGFEQAGTSSSLAQGWNAFQGGYERVTGNAHTGSGSIEITNEGQSNLAGAYQRIDLNQTQVKPVFIGGYVKGDDISMASGSYFGASLYAEIYFTDGTVTYWNSVPNTGTFDWRWIGFNTGSGFTTATSLITVTKPIAYILVVPILGNASGTAYFDDISVEEFTPVKGAVTIMFDDGHTTDITIAKPALDQYGFKGSAAISTELLDTPEHMSWNQVKTLANSGWNINSHGITHSDLTTLPLADADDEQQGSKNELTAQGLTIKSIAYPFGAYNGNVLAQSQTYYSSARSFEQGDNPQGVFPYNIKIRGVTNTTTVNDVTSWVNNAKNKKQWTVIVFHAIATSGEDQYYVNPSTFQAMIAAIKQSGVSVITYDQGVQIFKIGGSGTVPNNPTVPTTPTATTTIKVINTVINDNGGTKQVSNFPLFVGNTSVTSGVAKIVAPGTYTVSQTNQPGYTASVWGGDCAANGTVTLSAGQNKTCTITNNDNAPAIPASWATSISASATTVGHPINATASVKTNLNTTGVKVRIQMKNSSGVVKYEKIFDNQTLIANQKVIYTASWIPLAASQYKISVMVFKNSDTVPVSPGSQVNISVGN